MATASGNRISPISGRFSRETAAGYDRQVIEHARVVVVGCGALGQFLALALALIGFPDVVFVDMDTFEESNSSRSPFYVKDMNKAKATAAGARRLCTASGQVVYRYSSLMVQWLGDAILHKKDGRVIVLAAVDSQPARAWLSQRTRVMGVPLLEGGFHGERWNLSIFPNGNGTEPCWSCTNDEVVSSRVFSCNAYARKAIQAGVIPATAPGAMTLAGWQMGAAVALLHGDSSLANCTVFGDIKSGATRLMRRELNPACHTDHRIRSREAVQLKCGPEDSVRTLLAEAGELVKEPVVQLPASFIRTAPCAECHKPTLVEMPEWFVPSALVCTECNGAFDPSPGLLPERYGTLSEASSAAILEVPLRKLGLGPGLHLTVIGLDRQQIVALTGDAGPLLTTVEPEKPNKSL